MAISDFFVELLVGDLRHRHRRRSSRSSRCSSAPEALQIGLDRLLAQDAGLRRDRLRKATIARWTRTLSTMFAAGVPLVESLDSVAGASGNYVYAAATKQIQTEVSTGTSLTNAMTNTERVPDHGAADGADRRGVGLARRHAQQGRRLLRARGRRRGRRRSPRLLEPIIIVFLGVVIGGMVVAMYLPIFKLGQAV